MILRFSQAEALSFNKSASSFMLQDLQFSFDILRMQKETCVTFKRTIRRE